MKIDSSPEIQNVNKKSVRIPDKKQNKASFDAVLRNSIQNSDSHADAMRPCIQPLIEPAVVGSEPSVSRRLGVEAAQRVLDRLETYQKLLADPEANMKTINSAVGQMEQQAECTKPLLENLPEQHPLRMVIEESLQNVYQEVERFNAGYYVDD